MTRGAVALRVHRLLADWRGLQFAITDCGEKLSHAADLR